MDAFSKLLLIVFILVFLLVDVLLFYTAYWMDKKDNKITISKRGRKKYGTKRNSRNY